MSEAKRNECRLDRLVMLRKHAGLSQRALADKAGITASALSMIEAGDREPKLSTAFALADALNTTVDDIAGRVSYPSNETTTRCELIKAQQRLAQIAALAT